MSQQNDDQDESAERAPAESAAIPRESAPAEEKGIAAEDAEAEKAIAAVSNGCSMTGAAGPGFGNAISILAVLTSLICRRLARRKVICRR